MSETSRSTSDLSRYISPDGLRTMREELNHLLRHVRPGIVETVSWAAGNGDRSENGDYIYGKKRLREIDRRVRFLTRRIETAIAVDPAQQTRREQVFFGATVTYVTIEDQEVTVTILGADEADLGRGEISLLAPAARALMGHRVGDELNLVTPRGREVVEILNITYPEPVG
ncbi:MAG: transcription elongation factor GreB [Acetobacter sp.]|jgi:transcription elongation factor GreB